ncbi:Nucleoporin-like protein 2 [Varanus komodoensis]|nr:Nucleoporin-like protein 2 [Varanus komodoensis]
MQKISELKNVFSQPPPAFGLATQQQSTFRAASFPVAKQNSAQGFVFKSPSDLASVSTGGTPTFGSAPAFGNLGDVQGAAASAAASQSVGFGNQPAPSAAAFSFKTSAAPSGFEASGFSGFGKSVSVISSDTTSTSVFGTGVTAVDSSPLNSGNIPFGQQSNVFGSSATLASPVIPTNVTSEKLFTLKTELSAEELRQFEAKKFTLGKIPLKPPPVELLSM